MATSPTGYVLRRSDRLNVLLVEDNDGDAAIISHHLSRNLELATEVTRARSVGEARALLLQSQFDIILLDLNLPDVRGRDAAILILQIAENVPLVVLSGVQPEGASDSVIGLGAEDYLVKGELTAEILARTIRHAVERNSLKVSLEQNLLALERERTRFAILVRNSLNPIMVVDERHVVHYLNPAAETMLSGTGGGQIGGRLELPPADARGVCELELGGGEGDTRVVEARGMATFWDGMPAQIVTLHDVTARKASERLLASEKRAAERANAMKSEFLANMSHEFRTPLNAMTGFSELLLTGLMGPLANERQRGYVENIRNAAGHLTELVEELLDLSMAESGQLRTRETEFALETLLSEALQMVGTQAMTAHVRLQLDEANPAVVLRADRRLMTQVVLNLLENAVKFTRDDGEVTVRLRRRPDGGLRLSVADTGIGMPPDQVAKAFAMFVQLENAYVRKANRGAGIGLALSRRIVEHHGGAIGIDSSPGEGTTVNVDLPPDRVLCTEEGDGEPSAYQNRTRPVSR